jgi:transcriptional antiterminator RfaH
MRSETTHDVPSWYVIHTNPKQEDRAFNNLKAWNVETFSPKLCERRYHKFAGPPTYTVKPLFPRYIFARFVAHNMLHKVSFTRGVHGVVNFGDGPIPVDDEIIEIIRLQADADGFTRIGEELRLGDRVIIKDGPLKNFTGIFEREVKHTDRVMLLLNTISYQSHVIIERELIRKAG